MKMRLLLSTLATLLSISVWAAPAPWFQWRSPDADHDICAQTSPGDGWIRIKGPFEDANCKKAGAPSGNWK